MIFNSIVSKRKIVKPCNFSSLVKRIEDGESWKATKDCWMAVRTGSSTPQNAVYVNDTLILGTNSSVQLPPCVYIRKGSTVNFATGTGFLDFYGCIE